MNETATLLLLCTAIFAQQKGTLTDTRDGKAKAPYEATWMKLTKVGDSYVVYNYPSLWPDAVAGTKSPEIVKIQGNQMTWITYSDDIFTCSLKKVEKKDNGVYFLQTEGCSYYYEFQWEDEKKHIAIWKDYMGYITKKPIGVLYIDSLYNTFPIVDYDWGPPEDDNGYWD